MNKRSSSLHLPGWMHDAIEPFRPNAALAIALGVTASCCAVLLMFMAGYLISRTALPGTTLFMIMVPIAFVQLFGFGRPIARYFERLVSHDWVFRVTSLLRLKLFRIGAASASNGARKQATGSYLGLMVDGIGHLQNLYLRVAFPAITALALFVGSCIFCGIFDAKLAITALAFGIVSVIVIPAAAFLATRKEQIAGKSLNSREYELLTDDIIGSIDWTLADRCDEARRNHGIACFAVSKRRASVRRATRVTELLSALFLALGVFFMVLSASDAFQGNSDAVPFIAAFTLAAFPLMESYLLLPAALAESTAHQIAIDDLNDIVAEGQLRRSRNDDDLSRAHHRDNGGVVINQVSYRYPESTRLSINEITLHIPSGQHVAVIGRSGSGKSTLGSLMRGAIAPDTGTVSIDGMQSSAAMAGYIPQTAYLFDRSLRDNLKLGNPDATDGELVSALDRVGLTERFRAMPLGLDTLIGETGDAVSGGEAHRIALARALLADRPFVIVDEPFAALDPLTERELLDTLLDAFANKTLVVITHHLAGIERFDRVVQLDAGRITLDGAPSDLAESAPSFKRLLDFDRAIGLER